MAYASVGCRLPLEGFIRRYQLEVAISFRAERPSDNSKHKLSRSSVRGCGIVVAAPNKEAAGGVSSGPANGNRNSGAPLKRRKGSG